MITENPEEKKELDKKSLMWMITATRFIKLTENLKKLPKESLMSVNFQIRQTKASLKTRRRI